MTTVEVKELKKEVRKYINKADERTLKAVYAMLETNRREDWWGDISEGERLAIETGLKQMEEGKTTPHEEVMKKYSKWLTK
jgi:predicted transcriptional regulator